jgi:hypothetical protein
MVFFPQTLFAGQAMLSTAVTTSMLTTLTANVVKDFFIQIFLNPGSHFVAVVVICAVAVAPVAGLIFLTKKVYDKYCPDHPSA